MSALEQKYFHDRFVLLLVSVAMFLTLLGSLLILLRIDGGRNEGYIVQYRSNLGISAFKTGNASDLLNFVVFGLIILISHIVLSYRIYQVNKYVSVSILGLAIVLLSLSIVVSNALLVTR